MWLPFAYKKVYFLFPVLIVLAATAALLIRANYFTEKKSPEYPEIVEIEGKRLSFEELSKFFKKLSEKRGGEYAFSLLGVASLPPNTDLHLLGHAVGDILYRQKGAEGIKICTNDFRNACSHSIVVGLLMDKGETALPEISEVCRQSPGGSGAYTMCFHGLGHGVLAYTGYNLVKAVALCQKTGERGESTQCVSGTIMEIISGGAHNRGLWEKERPKYLNPRDPLTACLADFIPENAKHLCLIYLTPYLWEAVGTDLGHPTEKDFEASFRICDKLPNSDFLNRDGCFGGFGKEFVALANNRDIRSVAAMNEPQMRQIYQWCLLAKNQNGSAACVVNAMGALYWGGENSRGGAVRFCNVINDNYLKGSCFIHLIGAVETFIGDRNYREQFCKEVPSQHHTECQNRLLRP